ncbi:TonB-dependent receptor [Novosphingobium resinovorum]|uniref:TonB-dependent receptor n=1 Tax=Novosphingobium TaxID=165696 RepID=UPI001B3C80A6|nr:MULTISPECIES: TonB-dependent receptor [Novosphingobium]MBF7014433.1 TonB-dependent receptor [Novosphingobium sp. HR1a]WJM25083.1 TonB-dependent receptor [Novosphingobium resinovorum]
MNKAFACNGRFARLLLASSALAPMPGWAQTAGSQAAEPQATETAPPTSFGIAEIIVTAQKRSQSINEVPLSITAASGEQLLQAGISSTADLAKIVPGLTAQPSPFNTPIYTLRGIGFVEFSLATPPTVAVYTDEVPLPFSAMTKAAALDVARVEVLKGPQGTLFGQNTTGGAINFVAAKPTQDFQAGADLSYSRFDTIDAQGFVSGPITPNLLARFSARAIRSGPWQKSSSTGDELGNRRETQARLLLDWQPTDTLKVALNVNGWLDKSDSQAPQRTETFISAPGNPNEAPIRALPPQPLTSRSADWTTDLFPLKHDDRFVQASLRVDYDLSDTVTLTSISAYNHYRTESFQDYDATPLQIADILTDGKVTSLSQELRLTGTSAGLRWIVGANYQRDKTRDHATYYATDATTHYVGPMEGGNVSPVNDSLIKTAALFANVEYEVIPNLTVQAGLRYTDSRRDNASCALVGPGPGGNESFAPIFEFLQTLIRPGQPVVPIAEGQCYSLTAEGFPLITPLKAKLNEDNLSWRAGVNYKTGNRGLIYATVSRGYKAGSFPTVAPATAKELAPVAQESITAYEVGFKQPLFDHAVQLNGAVFYYDYKDKQLRGRILDQIFGPLDALVQVPKSRVKGAELEVVIQPADGLHLNVAGTYLDTEITRFTGFNQSGELADFSGARFPFSPKWSVVADAGYDFPLTPSMQGFVGASANYNSRTTASIGDIPQLEIRAYTLVDLRAGVHAPDDSWRFSVWGRNVFNKYYWTSAFQTQDVYVRYTGRPATYGATFSYRF